MTVTYLASNPIPQEDSMAAAKSAKKAAVKKSATKKQPPTKNVPAAKTAMTKSAILEEIAGNTGLTKKQVYSVFDELTTLIERRRDS